MRIWDAIKISMKAVFSNKLRSGLTALGIIIGISSVIIMITLGQGAQSLILGQISSTGSKTIYVEPGAFDPKKAGNFMTSATEEMSIDTLKYDDAKAVKKIPGVASVAAMVYGASRVSYKGADEKYTFLGTTPDFFKLFDVGVSMGREMMEADNTSMEKVVILGQTVRKQLFGEENPIGKKIKIKDVSLRVIGVTEEKGMKMMFNLDETMYMPLLTVQKLIMGKDNINMIMIDAQNEKEISQVVDDTRLLLRDRHHISNPKGELAKDDFKVMSQKEAADMVSTVTTVLTLFLSLVAAVSLLVGGIGIMNIMFVSVTERTREIGLRKAVGAANKDIMMQFLIEAIILTIAGGIVGILSGLGFAYLGVIGIHAAGLINWGYAIPYTTVGYAFGICVVVGIIFGIYPARAAARKNPIEALRYE